MVSFYCTAGDFNRGQGPPTLPSYTITLEYAKSRIGDPGTTAVTRLERLVLATWLSESMFFILIVFG
mgnify:CR=1 FL=1